MKLFLVACIITGLTASTVSAAEPAKVRISYSSRSNAMTPFYFAVQKGLFAAEGMDVEFDFRSIRGLEPPRC